MPARAKPLIPVPKGLVEVEFPTLLPVSDHIYLGMFSGKGVFAANELTAVFQKDETVELDLHGELRLNRRKKIAYKSGAFFIGESELLLSPTDNSLLVTNLMEGYIESTGEPLRSGGFESLLSELAGKSLLIGRDYLDLIREHSNGSLFSHMKTLADGYDNEVLKVVNKDCMVFTCLYDIPEGFIFDTAFYDALMVVGSKPFRVGFDAHGRLVFFTTNTAVIVPNLKNEKLAGRCTQDTFSRHDSECGVVVSDSLDTAMAVCSEKVLPIGEKISSLLDKKSTSTPLIGELATGKGKWRRLESEKRISRGSVELRLAAECGRLEGCKLKNIKVIIQK